MPNRNLNLTFTVDMETGRLRVSSAAAEKNVTQVKDAVENLGRDGSRAMGDLQEGAENAAKGVEAVDQQAKELQSTPLDDKLHAAVMAMKALAAEQENLSRRRLLPEGVATEAERIGMAIETVQERLDELRTQPVDTPIDPSASEEVQQLEQQLGRLQGEMSDLDANTRAVSNTTSGLGRTFGEVEDELRKQIRAVEESTVEFQRGRVGLAQYQLEQAGLENATQDTQDRLRGLVRTLEQVEDANNEARQATQEHTTDLDRLRNVAVLAFAAFGVRELLDYGRAALSTAEDARGLEARLNLLNSATVKQGQAFQNVVDIAVATGANLNATGNLYQRIGQATQTLNVSQQQIINTVKGLNTLLAVSNTTGEEAASVITQYAQAVGEGRLRAEEFNAILSAAPGFAQLLADSLGVSVDALRTLSEQGRITGLDLINVFQGDNAKALEAQFKALPENVGRSLETLRSVVSVQLKEIDEELNLNQGIALFLDSISTSLDGAGAEFAPALESIANVAGVLAAVISSRLVTSLAASSIEFVKSGGLLRAFGLQAQFAALRAGDLTRAQLGLNVATKAGQGALALLGGPVGLALVVAQLGAYALFSHRASEATEDLEKRVRRLTDATKEATQDEINAAIEEVFERINSIREQQAQLADRGIFPPALGESVQRLEMQLAQLQQRLVDVDANNKNAGKSASGLSKTFVELEGDIRKQIKSLTEQTIELERGAVGLVEYQLEQAGLGNASEKTRERFEALVRALRNATKASDDAKDAAKQQKEEEQARARALEDLNDIEADQLDGLTELALEYQEQAVRLQEIIDLHSQDAEVVRRAIEARERLTQIYMANTSEYQRQQDVAARTLDDLDTEIQLARLSNRERERELIVRRAIQEAQQAGRALSDQEIGRLREAVDLRLQTLEVIDQQTEAERDLIEFNQAANEALTQSITDFITSGFQSFESLVDFAEATLQEIIATFARQQIVVPIITELAGGAGVGSFLFGPEVVPGGGPPAPGRGGLSGFGNAAAGAALGFGAGRFTGNGSTASGITSALFGAGGAAVAEEFLSGFLGEFAGPLGGVLGGLIGGLVGNIFGSSPRIRVSGGIEQFKVNDPTDTEFETALGTVRISLRKFEREALAPIVDAITQFDAIAAEAVGNKRLETLQAQLDSFFSQSKGKDANIDEILQDRFNAIVAGLEPEIRALLAGFNDIEGGLKRLRGVTLVEQTIDAGAGLLGPDIGLGETVRFLDDVALANESLIETLLRVAQASDLYERAQLLVQSAVDVSREEFVRTADAIVQAAGGLDRARQLYEAFFNAVFDPDELLDVQAEQARNALAGELNDIGLNIDDFSLEEVREQLRTLFENASDPEVIAQILEAGEALGVLLQVEEERARRLAEIENERLAQEAAAQAEADAIAQEKARAEAEAAREAAREAQEAARARAQAEEEAKAAIEAAIEAERQLAADRQAFSAQIAEDIARVNPDPFRAQLRAIEQQYSENIARAAMLVDSESALDEARLLFSLRLEDLASSLIASAQDIVSQLVGSGSSNLTGALNNVTSSAAAAGRTINDLSGVFDRIRAFADSLLTDPNLSPLGPEAREDEIRAQLEQAIANGDFGAVEALARQLAQAIRDRGASSTEADQEILDLRELLLSLQPQITEATTPPTANQVGGIATDVGVLAANTNRQAELAAQFIERIGLLAEINGQLPLELVESFGLPIGELIEFLGIEVANPAVESVRALGLVAEELRIGLPELASAISFNLGELGDQDSLLNTALRQAIEGLTDLTDAQRQQLLNALAAGDVEQLEQLTGELPLALRNQLAPLLDGIDISDVAREQARLLEDVLLWTRSGSEAEFQLAEIMRAVNLNLGAIRGALDAGEPDIPGFIRGGLVTGPTIAALAEDGRPELIINNPVLELARRSGIQIGPAPTATGIAASLGDVAGSLVEQQAIQTRELTTRLESLERNQQRFQEQMLRAMERQTDAINRLAQSKMIKG